MSFFFLIFFKYHKISITFYLFTFCFTIYLKELFGICYTACLILGTQQYKNIQGSTIYFYMKISVIHLSLWHEVEGFCFFIKRSFIWSA